MDMKKVMLVFGTRPEAIKMAPLVKALGGGKMTAGNCAGYDAGQGHETGNELGKCNQTGEIDDKKTLKKSVDGGGSRCGAAGSFDTAGSVSAAERRVECRVCVTAQHREMLDMVLDLFAITPDYDLDLMSHGQTITDITVRVMTEFGRVLDGEGRPDLVLVHGDTTTTFAASLAAFYRKIPVGHVEAGLRTGNIYSPYPEEMNRRLTGTLATYHYAPTEGNRRNLLAAGVGDDYIYVTGNTVIDALHMVVSEDYTFPVPLLNEIDYDNRKVILLTAHRRENWGSRMRDIFGAVKDILRDYPDAELVFPVHLNKVVSEVAREMLGDVPRAHLIPPLDYAPFANLMARSCLVLTDSGGIQEEAPALGKPVLVLRTETERPEAVEAGTVKMAGVHRDDIYGLTATLLTDHAEYQKMARAVNPYGDGQAAEKIASIVRSRC